MNGTDASKTKSISECDNERERIDERARKSGKE